MPTWYTWLDTLRERISELSQSAGSEPLAAELGDLERELGRLRVDLATQGATVTQGLVELCAAHDWYCRRYREAPVGLVTLRGGDVIANANGQAGALLGHAPADLAERSFGAFVHESDRAAFESLLAGLGRSGNDEVLDLRLVCAAGASRAVRVHAQARLPEVWLTLLPKEPTPPEATPARGRRATGTVLVADPDPNVLTATRRLLRTLGYDVLTATAAAETVDWVTASGGALGCLLLDCAIAQHGGSLLRRLRAVDPDLPVILISGFGTDATLAQLESRGRCEFLAKPLAPEALAAAIDRVLRTSRP